MTQPTRMGLDIQGGIRVVLRAKAEELQTKQLEKGQLDTITHIMRNRVDALCITHSTRKLALRRALYTVKQNPGGGASHSGERQPSRNCEGAYDDLTHLPPRPPRRSAALEPHTPGARW